MREWRRSPAVALLIVSIFAVIQIGLPASRLQGDGQARRFGWQMFSTYARHIEFTVDTPRGQQVVELSDYVARVRADLPLEELLPAHLCGRIPDALSVQWDGKTLVC